MTYIPGGGGLDATKLAILNNLSDLNDASIARTNIGFGNVDNTSDANKPVSTATQTALDNKLDDTQFNGVAKISVGTTTPVAPSTGDLWVDTN